MIILSLEKKVKNKNTNKILEPKIQSIVFQTIKYFYYSLSWFQVFWLLDGMSLQNNVEYLFDSYHYREDTLVSFSALVPPEPDLVHQFFLASKMSPKFPLSFVP